jgi:hypothetical protein
MFDADAREAPRELDRARRPGLEVRPGSVSWKRHFTDVVKNFATRRTGTESN